VHKTFKISVSTSQKMCAFYTGMSVS